MINIIVALIGGLTTAIPSIIINRNDNKSTSNLMNYRVEELTKQVEKHNTVIERVTKLENENINVKEDIKEIKADLKTIIRQTK